MAEVKKGIDRGEFTVQGAFVLKAGKVFQQFDLIDLDKRFFVKRFDEREVVAIGIDACLA